MRFDGRGSGAALARAAPPATLALAAPLALAAVLAASACSMSGARSVPGGGSWRFLADEDERGREVVSAYRLSMLKRSVLFLQCGGEEGLEFFYARFSPIIGEPGSAREVELRVDGGPPRVETWRVSDEGDALHPPDPAALLARLAGASSVRISAPAPEGGPEEGAVGVSLRVAGLDAVLEEAGEICPPGAGG